MKKQIPAISGFVIGILFIFMILTDIAIAMNKWGFVVLIGMGIIAITVLLLKICDKRI